MEKKLVAGFDPGGKNHFGWSLLESCNNNLIIINAGVSSNAHEAVKTIVNEAKGKKIWAAGVDGPLYWPIENSRRCVEDILRAKTNGVINPSILSVNSLQGACLAQSLIVMDLLINKYTKIKITETHPKILFHFINLESSRENLYKYKKIMEKIVEQHKDNEHVRDAVLSAIAASNMLNKSKKWINLMKDDAVKSELKFFPAGEASYYMPENFLKKFI